MAMTLDDFPITRRWPAAHPDRLQLYSWPTPNGVKVSIMLEELGLPYEPHAIDIGQNETFTPRLPVAQSERQDPGDHRPPMVRPAGRSRCSSRARSCSISRRRRAGSCQPTRKRGSRRSVGCSSRWRRVGPMFGQLGFFHTFAGRVFEDKRPLERYRAEAARLLRVLETRLDGRDWMAGDAYTIADIALIGWVRAINAVYAAGELVGWSELSRVQAWLDRCLARPAVERGLAIPGASGLRRPGGLAGPLDCHNGVRSGASSPKRRRMDPHTLTPSHPSHPLGPFYWTNTTAFG